MSQGQIPRPVSPSTDADEQPYLYPRDTTKKILIPNNFNPRAYQIPLYNSIPMGFRRGLSVWHRRAGKDKTFLNITCREAFKRVGTYFYVMPYYKQAKLAIWEGFDKTGFPNIAHFPEPLILRKDNQSMALYMMHPEDTLSTSKARTPMGRHKPGSIIRFLGSDNPDALVGPAPVGIIMSEYSLHRPAAWRFLEPILLENDGWALFNGTPRGTNQMWDMYQTYLRDPENKFVELKTIEDTYYIHKVTGKKTPIISREQIEQILKDGTPKETVEQEYYCSFTSGNVGTYYASYINALKTKCDPPQITSVPWDPKLDVITLWDLGISKGNAGAVWFLQYFNHTFRFINYIERENKPLVWWFKQLQNLPYHYIEHFAPHDIDVRDIITLDTRRERCLRDHDFAFTAVPKLSLKEGIDEVQSWLPLCWFDEEACKEGLDALKNYSRKYDEERKAYSDTPIHNWASNGADSFRSGAVVRDLIPHIQEWELKNIKTSFHDRDRR